MRFLTEDLTVNDIITTMDYPVKGRYYKIDLTQMTYESRTESHNARPFPFLTQVCGECVNNNRSKKIFAYFNFNILDRSAMNTGKTYDYFISFSTDEIAKGAIVSIPREEAENHFSNEVANVFNNKTPVKVILKDGTWYIGKGLLHVMSDETEIEFSVKNFVHRHVFSGEDSNPVVNFLVLTEEEYDELPSMSSMVQDKSTLPEDFSFIIDNRKFESKQPSRFMYPPILWDLSDPQEVVDHCGYTGECMNAAYLSRVHDPEEGPEFDIPESREEIEDCCVRDYFNQFCEMNGIKATDGLFERFKKKGFAKLYLEEWDLRRDLPTTSEIYKYYCDTMKDFNYDYYS